MNWDAAERVRFTSTSPVGFADLLGGGRNAPAADIEGLLVLPEKTGRPLPLVILTLGSVGIQSGREELYARAFADAGIATLVVDSLGSRGFSETFSDQGRLSFATSCSDALNALGHMAADERIDPARIAMFGYSRGGGAVLLCDDERLAAAVLGDRARFAAYVALYPSTWIRWEHPKPAARPLLAVLGEIDIMVPLSLGRLRVEQLVAAGAPIETVVIEDASHGFDSIEPLRALNNMNMRGCHVLVGDDGSMEERASGVRLEGDWSEFVNRLRDACGKLVAVVGNGPRPRTVAVAPVLEFLQRAFAK